MAVHCPECGAENMDSAQLCFSCGTPLEGDSASQLIGTVMFDSYRITKVLGAGGMAVVYLGVNQLTGQEVAIKMLPPELAAYAEVKTRFLEEARTLAKLEHPNIVHLINFAEDEGRLCLVMQYAEGETFEDQIDRLGRIEPSEAVRVCIQTLQGLRHAHEHDVVHRDIKPSNIMVRTDGSVKVTDFGIAKITRDNKLTQTGQTMGTVRYMAPEQVRGKGIDHRTDLYALGISLYEAVVGEPPFDGESQFEVMQMHLSRDPQPPREVGAPISEALEAVILKAIAKPQDERYQDAREFREALKATPEGMTIPIGTQELKVVPAPVESTPEPGPDPRPRRGWWVAAILALVVILASGITIALVLRGEEGAESPGTAGAGAMGPMEARARPRPRSVASLPAKHAVLEAIRQRIHKWAVAQLFKEPHPLFIYSDRPLDAKRVAIGYIRAYTEYSQLLMDDGIDFKVEARPLTLVLLSDRLLNDKAIWTSVPSKREGPDFYIPARVHSLLFVVSNKPYSERQLRYDVALHLCPLKVSNERCIELARKFEKNQKVDFLP